MKKILSVIMGVLLFAGAFTPQNSNAATVFVEIGDRPYYTHGGWYWYARISLVLEAGTLAVVSSLQDLDSRSLRPLPLTSRGVERPVRVFA